jgi:glutathione synthase/RimK-type ligase-like ATP-grasp enzyme
MFLANGKHTYVGEDSFKDVLLFDGEKFIPHEGIVHTDAVLDRSALKIFPDKNSKITLNNKKFKTLCASKILMDDLLKEYMPHSYELSGPDSFPSEVGDSPHVLKPVSGLGGKGIFFGTGKELEQKYIELYASDAKEYLLQEFIETDSGIPGIVLGRHDMRVVLIGGIIRWVTIRTPKDGSLCANVAQGGEIRDITSQEMPKEVLEVVGKIAQLIESKYGKHLIYSIDFGVANGRVVVFEINDQIGFPNENMSSRVVFIESLIQELVDISCVA